MKKVYTKTFEFKGQMVNYYNKIKDNPKIAHVYCGFFVETGYTIQYWYK